MTGTRPRVGVELSAETYWRERASEYASRIEGPYHRHRLAVVDRLLAGVELAGSTCVDLGCGEGVLLERLARSGARVTGLDIDDAMIASARRRLAAAGVAADLRTAGVEGLEELAADSVDLLLALNVAAYFSSDEDERFYAAAARVLRTGGSLVITHSNELFDLYTLNSFTVAFFERHFDGSVAPLLTHPDEPDRIVFNIRENPLRYRCKLARYGLDEVQQEFINLHPHPPLLMDPGELEDIDARSYPSTLDWEADERWKLMFRCSMFGSRSVAGAVDVDR